MGSKRTVNGEDDKLNKSDALIEVEEKSPTNSVLNSSRRGTGNATNSPRGSQQSTNSSIKNNATSTPRGSQQSTNSKQSKTPSHSSVDDKKLEQISQHSTKASGGDGSKQNSPKSSHSPSIHSNSSKKMSKTPSKHSIQLSNASAKTSKSKPPSIHTVSPKATSKETSNQGIITEVKSASQTSGRSIANQSQTSKQPTSSPPLNTTYTVNNSIEDCKVKASAQPEINEIEDPHTSLAKIVLDDSDDDDDDNDDESIKLNEPAELIYSREEEKPKAYLTTLQNATEDLLKVIDKLNGALVDDNCSLSSLQSQLNCLRSRLINGSNNQTDNKGAIVPATKSKFDDVILNQKTRNTNEFQEQQIVDGTFRTYKKKDVHHVHEKIIKHNLPRIEETNESKPVRKVPPSLKETASKQIDPAIYTISSTDTVTRINQYNNIAGKPKDQTILIIKPELGHRTQEMPDHNSHQKNKTVTIIDLDNSTYKPSGNTYTQQNSIHSPVSLQNPNNVLQSSLMQTFVDPSANRTYLLPNSTTVPFQPSYYNSVVDNNNNSRTFRIPNQMNELYQSGYSAPMISNQTNLSSGPIIDQNQTVQNSFGRINNNTYAVAGRPNNNNTYAVVGRPNDNNTYTVEGYQNNNNNTYTVVSRPNDNNNTYAVVSRPNNNNNNNNTYTVGSPQNNNNNTHTVVGSQNDNNNSYTMGSRLNDTSYQMTDPYSTLPSSFYASDILPTDTGTFQPSDQSDIHQSTLGRTYVNNSLPQQINNNQSGNISGNQRPNNNQTFVQHGPPATYSNNSTPQDNITYNQFSNDIGSPQTPSLNSTMQGLPDRSATVRDNSGHNTSARANNSISGYQRPNNTQPFVQHGPPATYSMNNSNNFTPQDNLTYNQFSNDIGSHQTPSLNSTMQGLQDRSATVQDNSGHNTSARANNSIRIVNLSTPEFATADNSVRSTSNEINDSHNLNQTRAVYELIQEAFNSEPFDIWIVQNFFNMINGLRGTVRWDDLLLFIADNIGEFTGVKVYNKLTFNELGHFNLIRLEMEEVYKCGLLDLFQFVRNRNLQKDPLALEKITPSIARMIHADMDEPVGKPMNLSKVLIFFRVLIKFFIFILRKIEFRKLLWKFFVGPSFDEPAMELLYNVKTNLKSK